MAFLTLTILSDNSVQLTHKQDPGAPWVGSFASVEDALKSKEFWKFQFPQEAWAEEQEATRAANEAAMKALGASQAQGNPYWLGKVGVMPC